MKASLLRVRAEPGVVVKISPLRVRAAEEEVTGTARATARATGTARATARTWAT